MMIVYNYITGKFKRKKYSYKIGELFKRMTK